jgi:TonB family protein
MKTLLLAMLLVSFDAVAQAQVVGGQSAPAQSAARKVDPEQEAAIREAARLNATSIELFKAGKIEEALQQSERVLAIREKALPANDPRIAATLANLAVMQLAKKDYDKAEQFYLRALAIHEAAGEKGSNGVIDVLDGLILLAATRGKYDKAESLAERLIGLTEKKYPPTHIEMARSLMSLAEVYRLQGENKKALAAYARIMDIVEKTPPASVPKELTGSLANYLGLLFYANKSDSKTAELAERISKLFVAIAASPPPGTKEIPGGLLNGKAIFKPQPEYPLIAMQNRIQGIVTVQILVDETGKVIEARAISSPDRALGHASEVAARGARFTPTLISGVPVKVTGIITYRYILQ